MPNGSSIGRKLKGEDWFGFHDKTHIWFYTPEHWEMLLCETGLIVEFTGGDGLGYSPYFKGLPSELDTLLIKFPTQIAGIMHFPLPKNWNETIYFVCRKNLGWESEHYKRQNKLVSKGK